MRRNAGYPGLAALVLAAMIGVAGSQSAGYAHCDTLDGPVVASARVALEKGDVTPVLKWVRSDDEAAIKDAFGRTLVVRKESPEARDLADMYFFETLVRIHRAGEGAPYTGLKPAGSDAHPAVSGADKALQTGSVDALIKLLTDKVSTGIRERYAESAEAKIHADDDIAAGRRFVASYVEFVHYAERLYDNAALPVGHHMEDAGVDAHEGH